MKIALIRLGIYLEWSLFFYLIFFILDLFIYNFLATTIALLITVSAFLNKRNSNQHKLLKRPIIEIYHV
jgi:ABC-type protease/lipase transport system fused ATPase/permease subunit